MLRALIPGGPGSRYPFRPLRPCGTFGERRLAVRCERSFRESGLVAGPHLQCHVQAECEREVRPSRHSGVVRVKFSLDFGSPANSAREASCRRSRGAHHMRVGLLGAGAMPRAGPIQPKSSLGFSNSRSGVAGWSRQSVPRRRFRPWAGCLLFEAFCRRLVAAGWNGRECVCQRPIFGQNHERASPCSQSGKVARSSAPSFSCFARSSPARTQLETNDRGSTIAPEGQPNAQGQESRCLVRTATLHLQPPRSRSPRRAAPSLSKSRMDSAFNGT
jgi:hypothetical protein